MAKPYPILFALLAALLMPANEQTDYQRYLDRLDSVKTVGEIYENGFTVLENMLFAAEFENFGMLTVITALDPRHGRIILFLADWENGKIVYKSDDLACNHWIRGELNQPNVAGASLAFRDMNHDGWKDIILITKCLNRTGPGAGMIYRVGDVLFQRGSGFYRDWRLSGQINRFGMNNDVDMITAFVRDGVSTEFLYYAETLGELMENGFQILSDSPAEFEKFGEVKMVLGTYRMSGYYILMAYLEDGDGNLLWNFQPMGRYTNFTNIRGIALSDIDGDGLTDVVFLIRCDTLSYTDETIRVTDYVIYYQRGGYFEQDTAFQETYACTEGDTVSGIAERAAAYWRKMR